MPNRRLRDVVEDQDLLSLAPSISVHEAARQMKERHVGTVLVVERDRAVGIFTERDLLQRVLDQGRDPDRTILGDVMTRDPVMLHADEQGIEAIRTMREEGVHHIVVHGLAGGGYGIVSTHDYQGIEILAFEREFEFETRVWETV